MSSKTLAKKTIVRIADRLLTVLFSICILIIVFILFQVTTFATFHIPSDSMYPALQAGDNVLVNKWIMGTRIFNVWDALEDKEVDIRRLPGIGKIKRNDVLVFNFPYPAKKDSLAMDVMLYYVKRCIALPKDTLKIRNGFYKITRNRGKIRQNYMRNRGGYQWEKLEQAAKMVMEKEPKVHSTAIKQMREEIKKLVTEE